MTATSFQIPEIQREFIIAEFTAMRDEIELHLAAMNRTSQLAVAASAAIFVFVLSQTDNPHFSLFADPILAAPFMVSAVCAYHYYNLLDVIRMIAAYIRTVEDRVFGSDEKIGWHHYLGANDARRVGIRNSRRLFWSCLMGFNLFVGGYLIWNV